MSNDSANILTQLHNTATVEGVSEYVLASISGFLESFDPSQFDEASVLKLRDVLEILSTKSGGTHAIDVFYTAIQRYPPHTLTPVHHFLVRQCCMLRCYDLAMPLLNQVIDDFPKSHHLTYQDHLLYHFYGGLCLTALENYNKALLFFSMTLAAGGRDTSQIQLDAYKKYMLIGLIDRAERPEFPRSTHNNARRTLEMLSVAYLDLADVFLANTSELEQVVEKHREEFARDGNSGLLNSALASIASHKITKLSKVYSSLRLSDISTKLSISEAEVERNLKTMISKGRISATIDAERWVEFPVPKTTAEQQLEELKKAYTRVAKLSLRMTQLQASLELDSDYVAKQARTSMGSESIGKGKGKNQGPGLFSSSKMEEDSDSGF